ncbi:hypothetical protein GCM10020331_039310 [Ectobacillus funiculus]
MLIPEMVHLTNLVRTELSLVERTVQSEIPEFTIEQGELKSGYTGTDSKKTKMILYSCLTQIARNFPLPSHIRMAYFFLKT